MDKLTAIRECPLFQGIEGNVRDKLAALFQERSFAAGAILFREGQPAEELFVVVEGTIDIVKGHREDGTSGKLLSHIVPPSSLGEAALYGERPRSATAVAKDPSKVLALARSAFQQFALEDPQSAQQIFLGASRLLFGRLEYTSQELTAVYDLGKLLGQAPALPDLAKEVVQRLHLFVPQAELVSFHLWNMFSEEFEPLSFWPAHASSQAVPQSRQSPLLRQFEATQQTVTAEAPAGGFLLASPLVSAGKIIGFLSLKRSVAPFANEHRNLLEAVCGMMVGAVLSAWAREEEKARQRLMQAKERV